MNTATFTLEAGIPLYRPDLPAHWAGVELMLTGSGFGLGVLDPFNLGSAVGEAAQAWQGRRDAVRKHLNCPILWLSQVHGTCVAQPDSGNLAFEQPPPQADASCTTSPGMALAVLTADCLPVAFMAKGPLGRPRAVAVAHAGWRGLQAGVLENTVTALRRCQPGIGAVHAWLGPAIGPSSFEVGAEVRSAFLGKNQVAEACFTPSNTVAGKFYADLYSLASQVLKSIGVTVDNHPIADTFTDRCLFSHRAWQQGLAHAGRFATLIRLLP